MTNPPNRCFICKNRYRQRTITCADQLTNTNVFTTNVLCDDCVDDLGAHLSKMWDAMQEVPGGWK